jgi:hypothetical protein
VSNSPERNDQKAEKNKSIILEHLKVGKNLTLDVQGKTKIPSYGTEIEFRVRDRPS